MKKTFCDGCDKEIRFDERGTVKDNARLNLTIKASCTTLGAEELGQFAQEGLDLCRGCIDRMKETIDPKRWPRCADDYSPVPRPHRGDVG